MSEWQGDPSVDPGAPENEPAADDTPARDLGGAETTRETEDRRQAETQELADQQAQEAGQPTREEQIAANEEAGIRKPLPSESADPDVHRMLAERATAVGNGDDDARDKVDDKLAEMGYDVGR